VIENLLIWKFVAGTSMHKSQLEPIRDCVHVALVAPGLGESRSEQSYKCGDALDEQLETVSAQIAPGLSRSLEISLSHGIRISMIGDLPDRLKVV
jgi:hypothetical protein